MGSKELIVDSSRVGMGETGILVRAKKEGIWDNYDIVELEKESLLAWLKSRDGDNQWAEDVVGLLLGHGHLHK